MINQRGERKAGCVIYILVVIYAGIIGFQLVPVLYNNLALKDEMEQVAISYNQFRGRTDKMTQTLIDKAVTLNIPLEKKDIRIQRVAKTVEVTIKYKKEINFLFMKKKIELEPHVSKPFYSIVR